MKIIKLICYPPTFLSHAPIPIYFKFKRKAIKTRLFSKYFIAVKFFLIIIRFVINNYYHMFIKFIALLVKWYQVGDELTPSGKINYRCAFN